MTDQQFQKWQKNVIVYVRNNLEPWQALETGMILVTSVVGNQCNDDSKTIEFTQKLTQLLDQYCFENKGAGHESTLHYDI